jgi:hypothetical protein
MPSARTTETLIRNAVAAFQAAGLTVGAVEVLPKGGVRVIALEAVAPLTSDSGENLCDAVFGVGSD